MDLEGILLDLEKALCIVCHKVGGCGPSGPPVPTSVVFDNAFLSLEVLRISNYSLLKII